MGGPRVVTTEQLRDIAIESAMKIYTKTGDRGDTGLFGGPRVRKDCAADRSLWHGRRAEQRAGPGAGRRTRWPSSTRWSARSKTNCSIWEPNWPRPTRRPIHTALVGPPRDRGAGAGDRPVGAGARAAEGIHPAGRHAGGRPVALCSDRMSPGRAPAGDALASVSANRSPATS